MHDVVVGAKLFLDAQTADTIADHLSLALAESAIKRMLQALQKCFQHGEIDLDLVVLHRLFRLVVTSP